MSPADDTDTAKPIDPVSVEKLAAAAQPGAEMDDGSRRLLDEELKTLKLRRRAQELEPPQDDQLTGIALSGGGIRSATFCLGVLQALAKENLLKRFDYLSTVSGGGYMGSSLTWWLSGRWKEPEQDRFPEQSTADHGPGMAEAPAVAQGREFGLDKDTFPYGVDSAINVNPANRPTNPKEAAPHLLNYLRKHGHYLTPGNGINILSGISVGIRAIFLNLFVWIPLVTLIYILLYWLPRILFPYSANKYAFGRDDPEIRELVCSASTWIGDCLRRVVTNDISAFWTALSTSSQDTSEFGEVIYVVFWDVLIVSFIFAISAILFYVAVKIHDSKARKSDGRWLVSWRPWLPAVAVLSVVVLLSSPPKLPPDFQRDWMIILAAILAGTYGVLCLIYSFGSYLVTKSAARSHRQGGTDPRPGAGTPQRFARLARAGERLTSAASASASATARAAPEAGYTMRRLFESWAGVYLSLILVLVVIGSVPLVAGWLAAPSNGGPPPTPGAPSGLGFGSGFGALLAGLVATIAAFLRSGAKVQDFMRNLGFHVSGGFTATLAAALLLFGVLVISYQAAAAILLGEISSRVAVSVLVVAIASGLLVNINNISLGRFYRDRLLEAFMPGYQAVLQERTDAAPLAAERMHLAEASTAAPYHIVNTNVVLIGAKDRRRRIRGGDSFILTRDYCGSNATGWRRTEEFMEGKMTLASAMAISGAAANPNTGVGGVGLTRSRVVSVLMALVNLRLGYWAPHPMENNQNIIPNHFRPGLTALINGHKETDSFQELTDGGHFENLGIYELVRRRLRLILVCDGGQDADFGFQDLQVALHRIEEDFGARIEFCDYYRMEDMIPQQSEGAIYPKGLELAKRGFAVANIYYASDLDAEGLPNRNAQPAWLVYIKSTIVPELPLDLRGYRAREPAFPDQSTGDQFFDEDQFEAYRELGQRLAGAMIAVLRTDLDGRLPKDLGTAPA